MVIFIMAMPIPDKTDLILKRTPGFHYNSDNPKYILNSTITWWRHQMETFFVLLALCAGNSPATGEFPSQRPVTRSFYFFFNLRLNKQLSKQSRGWWFETPSRSLWRQCDEKFLKDPKTNATTKIHFVIFYSKTDFERIVYIVRVPSLSINLILIITIIGVIHELIFGNINTWTTGFS